MSELVQCDEHGEGEQAFVCSHLAEQEAGLGFNRNEPSEEDPYPDAWCDECELIREAHDGWNEESETLVTIRLLCSGCYETARIRNTRTDVTLDDLNGVRWKCDTCEEWHIGPCLNLGYSAPIYWEDDHEVSTGSSPPSIEPLPKWFLNDDFCIVDGEHFFVRGVIHLPIIGTAETFCWGVWGSLSKENFEKLVIACDGSDQVELPPMFSWLSNQIEDYEDTLNLKMYAHIGELDERPRFELEPTEHQLSQDFYHGITAERVKEIMAKRLREIG
ncbi:MAG TPA: DUF2199 domain-containing protein [Pyrinomonadaceae bacterium]|nr:DUF2199 domain-containing protein [Pyrinomonadaceae bacterium]